MWVIALPFRRLASGRFERVDACTACRVPRQLQLKGRNSGPSMLPSGECASSWWKSRDSGLNVGVAASALPGLRLAESRIRVSRVLPAGKLDGHAK